MLAKKKAMDNAKTPVAAPELDTKPVKKADTPAAEKKPATKESKPVNREGKPCPEKVVQKKKLCQRKRVEIAFWHVSFVCDSVYLELSLSDLYFFGSLKPSRNPADENELHVKRLTILRNTIFGFLKVCLREYQEK